VTSRSAAFDWTEAKVRLLPSDANRTVGYSVLKAITGSIRAARRASTTAAIVTPNCPAPLSVQPDRCSLAPATRASTVAAAVSAARTLSTLADRVEPTATTIVPD
jgi:hypothetical protein